MNAKRNRILRSWYSGLLMTISVSILSLSWISNSIADPAISKPTKPALCLTNGDGKSIAGEIRTATDNFVTNATQDALTKKCIERAIDITGTFAEMFILCQAIAAENGIGIGSDAAEQCLINIAEASYDQAIYNSQWSSACAIIKQDLKGFSINIAKQLRGDNPNQNTCAACKLTKVQLGLGGIFSAYASTAESGKKPNAQQLNTVSDRVINEFNKCEEGAKYKEKTNGKLRKIITGGEPVINYTLSVNTSAGGRVTGANGGINCGDICSASFSEGTVVNLVAIPDSGYKFTGWSGDCTGTEACSITMDGIKGVNAIFSIKPTYPLTISKIGEGTVISTDQEINCGPTCTVSYEEDTTVTLNALPDSGYRFSGWNGACAEVQSCTVTMNKAQTVGATFEKIVQVFSGHLSMAGYESYQDPSGATCNWGIQWELDMTVEHQTDNNTWNAHFVGTIGATSATSSDPSKLTCLITSYPLDFGTSLTAAGQSLSGTDYIGTYDYTLQASQVDDNSVVGSMSAIESNVPDRSASSSGSFQLQLQP